MAKKIVGLKVEKAGNAYKSTGVGNTGKLTLVKKGQTGKLILEIPITSKNITLHKRTESLEDTLRIYLEANESGSSYSIPISIADVIVRVKNRYISFDVKTAPLAKVVGTLGNKVGGGLGGGKVGPNDTLGSDLMDLVS